MLSTMTMRSFEAAGVAFVDALIDHADVHVLKDGQRRVSATAVVRRPNERHQSV